MVATGIFGDGWRDLNCWIIGLEVTLFIKILGAELIGEDGIV